jgi:hypothetical protein
VRAAERYDLIKVAEAGITDVPAPLEKSLAV